MKLTTKVSRRLSPFEAREGNIAGNESEKIYAGDNLNVPNVWELVCLRFTLVCDANAANRSVQIKRYTQSGIYTGGILSSAITANQTKVIQISRFRAMSDMWNDSDFYAQISTHALDIAGDDYIKIDVANGLAGDVLTFTGLFRWLNWEIGMMLPRTQKDSK